MSALLYLGTVSLSTATIVGLYLLFTGSGESFNIGEFLEETSPYIWAMMGIAMCIGFSVLGAGW
jgi:V-type H+-transporting ATPase proteolipid subunit